MFLLAYACSVSETFTNGVRDTVNRDEVKATQNFIETAYRICLENKTSSDLLGDLNELFKCIRCAVVSIGIMKWIEFTILDPSYFKINSDSSPIHLFILDEIVNCHNLLHDRVLNLLIKVFEYNFCDLDHLIQVCECYCFLNNNLNNNVILAAIKKNNIRSYGTFNESWSCNTYC